jgi:hypothetical protein
MEVCDFCDLILSLCQCGTFKEVLFMPTFDAKQFHEMLQRPNTRR